MSIWENKYQENYNKIQNQFGYATKREYVDLRILNFVGTLAQIKAEQARLEEQFHNKVVKERDIISKQVSELMDEYYQELYQDYTQYPKELCDMAYSLAYDKGHSYGHSEVENYFYDYIDYFIKAYELGMKHDK